MVIELVFTLSLLACATWTIAAVALDFMRTFGVDRDAPGRRFARAIWAELRPFYLLAATIVIAGHVMAGEMMGWNALFDAMKIWVWFQLKDVDEDDRWKRRKRKLAEKIGQRGGRLVVIPVQR